MNRTIVVALGAIALPCLVSSAALAQSAAAPSYQADPDVYKVIFEDQNFRVIDSVRKAGSRDKLHGHPLPSIIYFLNDCPTRQYTPDGKSSDSTSKAGTARAVPIIPAHSAENTGSADCHTIFVERK